MIFLCGRDCNCIYCQFRRLDIPWAGAFAAALHDWRSLRTCLAAAAPHSAALVAAILRGPV